MAHSYALAEMAGRRGSAPVLGWLGLHLRVVLGLSLYVASPPVSRAGYSNGLVSRLGYKSELLMWLRAPKSRGCQAFLRLNSGNGTASLLPHSGG